MYLAISIFFRLKTKPVFLSLSEISITYCVFDFVSSTVMDMLSRQVTDKLVSQLTDPELHRDALFSKHLPPCEEIFNNNDENIE